jgi:hypothetical protein
MKIIDTADSFIFNSGRGKLIFVLLGIMLFKTGVWFIPNIGATVAIAQDPFTNPFLNPNAHYLLTSWLSPYLAWLFGLSGNTISF